ncbi:LisH domain-containing protein C29A3.03c [Erysiphe neolycopersici]|uniref:GID complex catalytic subunit 2 n=1 Tax=Erysiphe neolycopersici TaxID=212602 RepID=A0A420H6W9_9PEZI|nr:LisH domain-containing protein C29A3.03c [Erysiphe neolycopersici]
MDALETELSKLDKSMTLEKSIRDVDILIEQLEKARETIVADPNSAPITLATLQNPLKKGFEQVNEDLNQIHKTYAKYGKSLDKKNVPIKVLPDNLDALTSHTKLINRAIAMHLIREGQFSLARTFLSEGETVTMTLNNQPMIDSEELQVEDILRAFLKMYSILDDLRVHNLESAIQWARQNSLQLEKRGSNIEFELCKLQYLWLFHGPEKNGLPDDQNNGLLGAYNYARANFPRHMARFPKEIEQLITALLYRSNLKQSPYYRLLNSEHAWEKIYTSFVTDFCSLLGLSSASPLNIACTAGAIALPTLLKFADIVRDKKTEWTTQSELPVEIPLPRSMFFHAIFVCPVSKEQTTEKNPAMVMPCGHVLAKESLQKISKTGRCKCPYCPSESLMRDAKEIVL